MGEKWKVWRHGQCRVPGAAYTFKAGYGTRYGQCTHTGTTDDPRAYSRPELASTCTQTCCPFAGRWAEATPSGLPSCGATLRLRMQRASSHPAAAKPKRRRWPRPQGRHARVPTRLRRTPPPPSLRPRPSPGSRPQKPTPTSVEGRARQLCGTTTRHSCWWTHTPASSCCRKRTFSGSVRRVFCFVIRCSVLVCGSDTGGLTGLNDTKETGAAIPIPLALPDTLTLRPVPCTSARSCGRAVPTQHPARPSCAALTLDCSGADMPWERGGASCMVHGALRRRCRVVKGQSQ